MKFRSYLTTSDRYNFLVDNIRINFYGTAQFKYHRPKLDEKGIAYSDIPRKIKVDGRVIVLSKKGIDILIRHSSSFNANTFLRYHLMSLFKVSRDMSTYEYHTNVIPYELRLKAKENGFSVSKLRDIVYEEIYRQILETKKWLKMELKAFDINVEDFDTSIYCIEIDFDIITPPNEHLNKNEHIMTNFNNAVKKIITGQYVSDKGETILKINTVAGVTSDTEPDRLTGCLLDKSTIKIYYKATYPLASINRAERSFYRKQVKLYTDSGSNVFNSKQELIDMITKLGHVTFDEFYPILSVPSHYSDEEQVNIAKQFIKNLYGYLWEEAFEALLGGKYSIHTGIKGKAPKKLAEKTRSIYRDAPDTLLVKKSCGVYTLNWTWILSKKL